MFFLFYITHNLSKYIQENIYTSDLEHYEIFMPRSFPFAKSAFFSVAAR